ncbi:dimethyladenosine transferase 2, mitochondrial [Galendromus occidentalis]|uniref:Dimethyladenosine transferase 2, mitochondrial n=1 Tax=Galendromus occidentalis TaxID=34638 RepID=A0AAJ7L811_9ACAR|nr:dimethyladenosine transferase 2, mitochondrial [Galendromus occidentalis]
MLRTLPRLTQIVSNLAPALISTRGRESSSKTSKEDVTASQVSERKRRSNHDAIYISDPDVASIVAEELRGDIAAGRLILEANPGPGILSKQLLNSGVQRLFLCEPTWSAFYNDVEQIRAENPDRVELLSENLVRMASLARFDLIHGSNRLGHCFQTINHVSGSDNPKITMVLSVPRARQRRFLLSLLHSYAARSLIFSVSDVEFLMFLSEDEYSQMFACRRMKARPAPLLFHMFFNHQCLASVGGEAFRFNSDRDLMSSKTKKRSVMKLVRLSPSNEFLSRFDAPERVEEFSFFVRQAFTRGATLLYLNELIPNAARDVLLKTRWSRKELTHLNVNTKLYSLAPTELLRLFELLSENPLFPQCPLATAHEQDSRTL